MAAGPFHAHVYFTPETRAAALALRDLLQRSGVLYVGEMREGPVGPHPEPQFEAHFPESDLGRLLPILEASGLTILVHPLTDDDLADHTVLARWIGTPLALDLTVLDPPGINQGIGRFGHSDV